MTDEQLIAIGVDTASVLDRFCGNRALLKKFLSRYADEPSLETARQALATGDMQAFSNAVHTIKGIAGNLSLDSVFTLSTRMMDQLRQGDTDSAIALFPQLAAAHDTVCQAIRNARLQP